MSANSYLVDLAARAVLSGDERTGIGTSIETIQSRLKLYFSAGVVSQHFTFGSYTRGTILPRYMDETSDIDYMVVFSDTTYVPQTYLDWLKGFAEYYYARSEIKQSFPTIALDLNHIRFELVPATNSVFFGLQIPDAGGRWQGTDPNGFNNTLTLANQNSGSLLKPAIRLVKYWNARAGYPFESYALEQKIVGMNFWGIGLLRDVVYRIFDNLTLPLFSAQWKEDRLTRARQIVSNARTYESFGIGDAEAEIAKLFR